MNLKKGNSLSGKRKELKLFNFLISLASRCKHDFKKVQETKRMKLKRKRKISRGKRRKTQKCQSN